MKNDNDSSEKTSRRQFTKAIVTAAVAVPIAATVACKSDAPTSVSTGPAKTDLTCPVTSQTVNGITESTWDFPVHAEEHIPPMGFDGGGSLIVDSKNELKLKMGAQFTFEDTIQGVDAYGEIVGATIIIEMSTEPFLKIKNYSGFAPGTQLWLWNQSLQNQQGPKEIDYEPEPQGGYPANDPDVKITGGKTGSPLSIIVKKKDLDSAKSHKTNRPYRYKHVTGGAITKHFRIAQYQFVKPNANPQIPPTVLAQRKGDDNYTIYLKFAHFQ